MDNNSMLKAFGRKKNNNIPKDSLMSQTSILKFIGIKDKGFVKKLKIHTFSQSWKTLFVHFQNQVKLEELQSIVEQFNSRQQAKSQELDNDEKKDYVSEQLEKRKQEISNPERNRCVLLKNVSTRETPQEVVDTLEELGYEVEEVERFKGMPVVKVIFSNTKDFITIGFNEAKCEIFDKYRTSSKITFYS
ncbi:hypothetical protein RFI_33143, partial [Reticulomyxa filosa]